ncbi:hypothetical protein QD47_25320, partial [Paenibacillus terrae]
CFDCPALPESPFIGDENPRWVQVKKSYGVMVKEKRTEAQPFQTKRYRVPLKNKVNSKVVYLSNYKHRKI